jgi:hypothetical protein
VIRSDKFASAKIGGTHQKREDKSSLSVWMLKEELKIYGDQLIFLTDNKKKSLKVEKKVFGHKNEKREEEK